METLLRNDFTVHYGLPISLITNIRKQTDAAYFEIEDDTNRETQLFTSVNNGTALYNNPNRKLFSIINYDKFITSFNANFQKGRKRCDLIVYTMNDTSHFLLNELKDANPKTGRRKAKSQLVSSLVDIMNVPQIDNFVNKFRIRLCCFFNKRITAPTSISATNAFNLINTITQTGFQLSNPTIESFGFTLYEYSGGKKFNVT